MTTVISFYTPDWLYPQHAQALMLNCHRLKVPYSIEAMPSQNSYLKNCCLKPAFILRKLEELRAPVLWVDCDASIMRSPTFFDNLRVDMAARRMPEQRKRTWHVGTIWVNYTPGALAFIREWVMLTGNLSDESALDEAWRRHGKRLSISDIPPEYFVIEGQGAMPRNTVIMHRISRWSVKTKDMAIAKQKREKGEF